MPHAETQYFGSLEYDAGAVIRFPLGLPGFDGLRDFLPIEQPATRPLVFLQSLDSQQPCFVSLPVELVKSDYPLQLAPTDLQALGLGPEAQPNRLLCLVMISMREAGWTANLLAPVVINLESRRAVQAVQADTTLSHQHPLSLDPPC